LALLEKRENLSASLKRKESVKKGAFRRGVRNFHLTNTLGKKKVALTILRGQHARKSTVTRVASAWNPSERKKGKGGIENR